MQCFQLEPCCLSLHPYIWGGAFFAAGFFCLCLAGATRALGRVRIMRNIGSSRVGTDAQQKVGMRNRLL